MSSPLERIQQTGNGSRTPVPPPNLPQGLMPRREGTTNMDIPPGSQLDYGSRREAPPTAHFPRFPPGYGSRREAPPVDVPPGFQLGYGSGRGAPPVIPPGFQGGFGSRRVILPIDFLTAVIHAARRGAPSTEGTSTDDNLSRLVPHSAGRTDLSITATPDVGSTSRSGSRTRHSPSARKAPGNSSRRRAASSVGIALRSGSRRGHSPSTTTAQVDGSSGRAEQFPRLLESSSSVLQATTPLGTPSEWRPRSLLPPPRAPPTFPRRALSGFGRFAESFVNGLPSSSIGLDDDSEACTICLESMVCQGSMKRLPCLHSFHTNCIAEWVRSHRTCPVCRFELLRDGRPQ